MKTVWVTLCLMVFMIGAAGAGELDKVDFEVKKTQDLIDLCTADPSHALYAQAINFCQGYLLGAFHYYEASVRGESTGRFVCMPDSPPSRNEIIDMFVQWAKDHPQYLNELPVETEFRFLAEKWPCVK